VKCGSQMRSLNFVHQITDYAAIRCWRAFAVGRKGARLIRSGPWRSANARPGNLALALFLASCQGDRIKPGMNVRQAQPQSTGLLT
jgi:hypothetical protein